VGYDWGSRSFYSDQDDFSERLLSAEKSKVIEYQCVRRLNQSFLMMESKMASSMSGGSIKIKRFSFFKKSFGKVLKPLS
jgi:hypothetical protein